jgi:DNA-directed RNA polymerase I, II, and III subunit RPABC2
MSDDEGGEDFGDYEDLAESAYEDEEVASEAPDDEPSPAEADEGLDEDAAGTDDEAGVGEGAEEIEEELNIAKEAADEGRGAAGASRGAAAQRPRVDPILRIGNKARAVHIVAPEDRITDTRLQPAEAARVLATRAQQIAKHATSFTDAAGLSDPVAIAQKELYDRRCPLILRRQIGTGPAGELLVEEFNIREMTLPPLASLLSYSGQSRVGVSGSAPGAASAHP